MAQNPNDVACRARAVRSTPARTSSTPATRVATTTSRLSGAKSTLAPISGAPVIIAAVTLTIMTMPRASIMLVRRIAWMRLTAMPA